jgi:hypothetical protein
VRIFISHSTAKDDDDRLRRLYAVDAALKAKPYEHDVLLDIKRLEASFEWRAELDEWMATCHAAVLLLTPKALESLWVLKEATILAHRAALDDRFLLFPALLDGLTRDQLKASIFSPLYLDALQRVGGTQPADIANAVLGQLAKFGKPPETRLDLLVTALAAQLKTAAEDNALEAICEKLTGKPHQWDSSKTRARGTALVVALSIVSGTIGGYASLRDVMSDLLNAGLSKDAAGRVLNLAGPRWVNPEAAARLAEVAARNVTGRQDEQGRAVSWSTAINGAYLPMFTAPHYVRRAYLPDTATFINLDGGESDLRLEELVARLRNEVRTSPLLKGMSDAQLDGILGKLKTPYFVLLPPPFPDAELLETLQTRYPKLTFIGQEGADAIAARNFKGRVVPLVPALEATTEEDALLEIDAVRQRIEEV